MGKAARIGGGFGDIVARRVPFYGDAGFQLILKSVAMASLLLEKASARVEPWEWQPGRAGQETA